MYTIPIDLQLSLAYVSIDRMCVCVAVGRYRGGS